MRKPKAIIRRSKSLKQPFRFVHVGLNGEVINSGETYVRKADIWSLHENYYPNFVVIDMTKYGKYISDKKLVKRLVT